MYTVEFFFLVHTCTLILTLYTQCEPIMADEGLTFTDTLQPAGDSSLDTEQEHSDTMSEILSLFQDSVPSSSHDLGYVISEDSLTDELRTLSDDELWTKTEDLSSPEEDVQPPPQKLMCLEEEHTAAEGEAQETGPQDVETQQPNVLERLGLSESVYTAVIHEISRWLICRYVCMYVYHC